MCCTDTVCVCVFVCVCLCAYVFLCEHSVTQSCPILCDPMDCSLPGSSVHGTSQARILEWFAMPPPGDLPNPGIHPRSSARVGRFFTTKSEAAQSCPTLGHPMDCSLPGSSLHGILWEKVLEWVAISFSRGSSRPRDRTRVSRIPGRLFNL